jgi:hypothetical protein
LRGSRITKGGGAVLVNANVKSIIVDATGAAAGVMVDVRGQDVSTQALCVYQPYTPALA